MTVVTKKQTLEINRKTLSSAGLRMTNQRTLILNIISRGHGHLDADEVYRQAREKQPRLSLSTVYRTLRRLKELGLVEELHFDEAHHHYEVKSSVEHHHLACLGCGKVVEFKCLLSQKMKENIGHEKGFEVTGAQVWMTGYCSKCRQKKR
ncbi:MAG: transcriptional repressor [Dehalococcoidia bacterium]|nr:MAG: transcriptional repressor [Dehalococcoidia bacterium]